MKNEHLECFRIRTWKQDVLRELYRGAVLDRYKTQRATSLERTTRHLLRLSHLWQNPHVLDQDPTNLVLNVDRLIPNASAFHNDDKTMA